MAPGTWLVKTEPSTYAWDDLVREGRTRWDGVANALALRHLAAMEVGDLVLVYHSGAEKAVVGLARVARAAYPDPAADDAKLVAVDLSAVKPVARRVTLAEIKAEPSLRELALVRMPRLSVMPIPSAAWKKLLALAGTKAA
jgi:predicted RNA-binding protein with PUA-like domain